MANSIIFLVLLLGSCGYALWRGGSPERAGALTFLLAAFLTLALVSTPSHRFDSVEIGILFVDASMFTALVVLSLRANRFWPLWVTALQAIGTAAHAVKLATPDVIPWAYAFALAFWSYPMLLILVIGTWNHQYRLARFGADKSWSSFSGRSAPRRRTGPTA